MKYLFFVLFLIFSFQITHAWTIVTPKIGDNMLIQLNWKLNFTTSANVYDIDLFDTDKKVISFLKANNKKVICYFSAWTYEDWRSDAWSFDKSIIWKALPEWAWESWLDVSNYDKFKQIMLNRMDLAVQKWCDWVDPDNVDWYTNDSGFNLTYADQLKYNQFLATQAHNRGLSIWLKNDLNQINDLVKSYDFAVNESCYEYNECSMLDPFIKNNKPVFWIEYQVSYAKVCSDAIKKKYSFVTDSYALDGSALKFCDKNVKVLTKTQISEITNYLAKIKTLKNYQTTKQTILNTNLATIKDELEKLKMFYKKYKLTFN